MPNRSNKPESKLTVVSQLRGVFTDQLLANIHDLLTVSAVIFSPFAQLISHLCGHTGGTLCIIWYDIMCYIISYVDPDRDLGSLHQAMGSSCASCCAPTRYVTCHATRQKWSKRHFRTAEDTNDPIIVVDVLSWAAHAPKRCCSAWSRDNGTNRCLMRGHLYREYRDWCVSSFIWEWNASFPLYLTFPTHVVHFWDGRHLFSFKSMTTRVPDVTSGGRVQGTTTFILLKLNQFLFLY